MLYIRAPEFMHCITGSLYPLNNISVSSIFQTLVTIILLSKGFYILTFVDSP